MIRILLLLKASWERGPFHNKSSTPTDSPEWSTCTRSKTYTSHSLMRSLTSSRPQCFRGNFEFIKGLISRFHANIWIKVFMKALISTIKITLQVIMGRKITSRENSESRWKNSNQIMKTFKILTSKCLAQQLSKIEES